MDKIKLSPPSETKFVLLGAGYHLCEFTKLLVEQDFPKPIIVTHLKEDHERDRKLLTDSDAYKYVFDVAKTLDLELIESTSVNKESLIRSILKKKCNAAFSLSCRSIIKPEFIKSFEGRVFNLHPSFLPKERGGGTFSWRIMNNQKEISATLHLVEEGIDTGAIIHQKKSELEITKPRPIDYIRKTNRIYIELLNEFLAGLKKNEPLKLQRQDESQATYLPRLHTETNGAIDWSWPVDDIERFIRAFSDPYPGAFTYVNDKRIIVDEVEVEPWDIYCHPYANGRIVSRLDDGAVRVIVTGGYLKIVKILVAGRPCKPASLLKTTDMLSTPPEILFKAKTSVVAASKMNVPELIHL